MKITNTKTGKAYQLNPGTQIEIERPNLFFNEWGEQTTPIELPDTDVNRELSGYPDMLGNVQRPRADIECTVQEGNYSQPARQAILGAKRKDSITTTLYLNEGSFLAQVDDTLVSDVFADETIPGVTTVEQAIEFCRQLAKNTSPYQDRFGIFPVLLASDETDDDGNTIYKWLNRYGYENTAGGWIEDNFNGTAEFDFYNAKDRTEKDGEDTIELPAGYYISPFLKANYLLKRILQHFGYELQDNFFSRTEPFTNMVLVNNCCDALVNGTVRLADLVPECTCGDILNVYRKKFCCEFVVDEVARTAQIVLFNNVVDADASDNLTPYLTNQLQIEPPDDYKRITLKSEDSTESDLSGDNPETLESMLSSYKYVGFDDYADAYYRCGFKIICQPGRERILVKNITEKITDNTFGYDTGESLTSEEISVPDCIVAMRKPLNRIDTVGSRYQYMYRPYIGGGKFVNSTISVGGLETESNVEATSDNESTRIMLVFACYLNGAPLGTTATHVRDSYYQMKSIGEYSLNYVGKCGLYEKFWRKMDQLYRNSLLTVTAELKLPPTLKHSLSAHLPVVIKGQKLLVDVLHYTIGGEEEPIESTFRTMRLYEPVNEPPSPDRYNVEPGSDYVWSVKTRYTEISEEEYNAGEPKGAIQIFPEAPSEKFADGQPHYQRISYMTDVMPYPSVYCRVEAWLECSKRGE